MERIKPRKRKEDDHEHLGTCLAHKDRAIRILYHAVAYLTKRVGVIEKQGNKHTRQLKQQGEQLMNLTEQVQAFKDKIAEVAQDVKDEKIEVQGKITTLEAQVKALQDAAAAGNVIPTADFDVVLNGLSELKTGVKDISEPTAPV